MCVSGSLRCSPMCDVIAVRLAIKGGAYQLGFRILVLHQFFFRCKKNG
uniref:Uncharacterized protein n=1 Tax=Anguilla anguilla TaxID=7936 RepID=A0A0E9XV45_ANGAN